MNNGYGLTLNEWIFDERIKNELRLLIYISSLTAKNGYCFASNEHFAKKFKTSTITISRQISKLIKLNYINVQYERYGQVVKNRTITINKNDNGDYQKCKPAVNKNDNGAVNKNVKENITSNNINSVSKNETTYKDEYIINLEKDETRKQIEDENEDLQFRIAKSLNNFCIQYCKRNGIKVYPNIPKAKASKEMWSIKKLLKDYEEKDVRKVIQWLYDGKGNADFWQRQIQSASGFRKKFEKMKLAMINDKQKEKRL